MGTNRKFKIYKGLINYYENKYPSITNMYLKTCWSPCFWHSTVRAGSYAVAVYTMATSLCIITYLINILHGGDSSQFYLPLFEADLHSSTQHAGRFCIIMFTLLSIFSALLMVGIKRCERLHATLDDPHGGDFDWPSHVWHVADFRLLHLSGRSFRSSGGLRLAVVQHLLLVGSQEPLH